MFFYRGLGKYLILMLVMGVITNSDLWAQEHSSDSIRVDTTALYRKYLQLRGKVVGGENKETLIGAYIYLGKKKIAVTSTNQDGKFVLKDLPEGEVVLSVSYIGYQLFSGTYDLKTNRDIGEICLQPEILEEVVVSAVPPLVVQRGDTTQFNATALKVAADADLEDLLKKLPGFELIDGKIMAQGKEVTKLYIDGMEYFFNDPAAALKNLPAKLIAKIKMYDDRSEEAKFSGYDDGNKFRSLNIETKNPNQLKYFGQAALGYGISDPIKNTFQDNAYQATLSANLFDSKRKITIGGEINNTGLVNSLPETQYSGPPGKENMKTLYTNLSYQFKPGFSLTGNYYGNSNNSYSASLSNQDYFPTEQYEKRIYDKENHSWNKSSHHSVSIRLNAKWNEKNRLLFTPTLSFGNNHSSSLGFGRNIENQDTLSNSITDEGSKADNFSVGGNFSWMHAFVKQGRTLTLRANGRYNRNTNDQSRISEEHFLATNHVYKDTLRNVLIANGKNNSAWSTSVTWSEPLTEHARLALNYDYQTTEDHTDKESFAYKDKGFETLIGIDTAQTSDLKNRYRIHGIGINYSYFREKLSFNSELALKRTRMDNHYRYPGKNDSLIESRYMDIAPRMNIGYHPKENRNIDFSYSGSTNSPDINQLQDVLNVMTPSDVSIGNPHLKKSYQHDISFSFNRAFPEKSSYFYMNLRGGQTFNQMASNVQFINRDTLIKGYLLVRGARLTIPVNLNGQWNTDFNGNYSFPWKKLKLRINTSLNYSFSREPSVYDSQKTFTNSHVGSLGINVSTNISEDFDSFLRTNSSYSYSKNSSTGKAHYFREDVNLMMNWVFWKGFFMEGEYNGQFYVTQKSETVNETKHLINLKIGKKFGKQRQLQLSLSAQDILDERDMMHYYLADLYSMTSYSTIPATSYMLTCSYRFNSTDKK